MGAGDDRKRATEYDLQQRFDCPCWQGCGGHSAAGHQLFVLLHCGADGTTTRDPEICLITRTAAICVFLLTGGTILLITAKAAWVWGQPVALAQS